MSADQWTKLLEVLVSLLQAISWPLIILLILSTLRKLLEDKDMSDFTFKASPTGGIEATYKRQRIEVASSLLNDEVKQSEDQASQPQNIQTIAKVVDQYITPQNSQKVLGKSILWVDDQPSNNIYARRALAALGISMTLCLSTEVALDLLRDEKYDVIISDMGRPPDPRAGYTLLAKIQEMKISTPYIIYASGGNAPQHQAEAQSKGAFGSTSGASRLLKLVMRALTEA